MVCKVFFAKKLSEKGRKSGNKLSGMLFASAMPCKCRQSTEKGRLFTALPRKPKSTNPSG